MDSTILVVCAIGVAVALVGVLGVLLIFSVYLHKQRENTIYEMKTAGGGLGTSNPDWGVFRELDGRSFNTEQGRVVYDLYIREDHPSSWDELERFYIAECKRRGIDPN